ncbi:hypothetical protein MMA231_02509 [Asticcacaulis sp. MM231]|uniref:helix-turn-helix transcriptional regulator n=1 Tax=Asticcacaulis sp. MM231 TaxID=3157666 RepID=UPI0032D58268
MYTVSYTSSVRHNPIMTNIFGISDADKANLAKAYGKALKRLRGLADMSQQEVADLTPYTQQTIQRYEKGTGFGFLDVETQEKVLRALGFTLADLEKQVQALDEPIALAVSTPPLRLSVQVETEARLGDEGYNVYESNRVADFDLESALGADTRLLQVVNEDAVPYAEPGGFVIYHLTNAPRRNQGVVIKLKNGVFIIRKYLRTTASHIETTRLEQKTLEGEACYVEVQHNIPLSEARRPYPITLRGD